MIDEKADSFFGKNLFILRDQKWKDMRSTLSPTFTGSKMRHMFSLITHISDDYMEQLRHTIKPEKEIEFKEFANKYCNDVIAKCAYGVSVNSLENENDFYKMGQKITTFPFILQLKFMGYSAFPKIMNVSKRLYVSNSNQLIFLNSFSKFRCSTMNRESFSPT